MIAYFEIKGKKGPHNMNTAQVGHNIFSHSHAVFVF